MAARVLAGDVGDSLDLRRRQDALRDLDAQHVDVGLALAVGAARQAIDLEVVGRHTVQEFLELLDLVLADGARGFLVVLIGNQQAGLGEHLAAHGWRVDGPLLAGHGTTPEDFARTRWQDWARSAAEAVDRGSLHLAPDDMRAMGVEIEVVDADPHAAEGCELVLVLGGDGTFLRAAELARNAGIAVLGVNLGRIGFLAEAEAEHIDQVLSFPTGRA